MVYFVEEQFPPQTLAYLWQQMLSDHEQREVLRVAREACEPEKVLIAGTGAESAHETLKMCEYAASLGYDVAMVRLTRESGPNLFIFKHEIVSIAADNGRRPRT